MECNRCKKEITIWDLMPGKGAYRLNIDGNKHQLCPNCMSQLIFIIDKFANNEITLGNILQETDHER